MEPSYVSQGLFIYYDSFDLLVVSQEAFLPPWVVTYWRHVTKCMRIYLCTKFKKKIVLFNVVYSHYFFHDSYFRKYKSESNAILVTMTII